MCYYPATTEVWTFSIPDAVPVSVLCETLEIVRRPATLHDPLFHRLTAHSPHPSSPPQTLEQPYLPPTSPHPGQQLNNPGHTHAETGRRQLECSDYYYFSFCIIIFFLGGGGCMIGFFLNARKTGETVEIHRSMSAVFSQIGRATCGERV